MVSAFINLQNNSENAFSRLKYLNLVTRKESPEILDKFISQLKNLKEITFKHNGLLYELTVNRMKLRKIKVIFGPQTAAPFLRTVSVESIECLTFNKIDIDNNLFEFIGKCKNIWQLKLLQVYQKDCVDVKLLADPGKLTALTLQGTCQITDRDFIHLVARLVNLKHLNIELKDFVLTSTTYNRIIGIGRNRKLPLTISSHVNSQDVAGMEYIEIQKDVSKLFQLLCPILLFYYKCHAIHWLKQVLPLINK